MQLLFHLLRNNRERENVMADYCSSMFYEYFGRPIVIRTWHSEINILWPPNIESQVVNCRFGTVWDGIMFTYFGVLLFSCVFLYCRFLFKCVWPYVFVDWCCVCYECNRILLNYVSFLFLFKFSLITSKTVVFVALPVLHKLFKKCNHSNIVKVTENYIYNII